MTYTGPIWEGVYQNFSDVPVQGPGFDGETWIENSLKRIHALREESIQNAPLPPISNYREALLPLLAGMVYGERRSARILDFGGGIGFTYFQTVYGMPKHDGLEFHIVEREVTCQAGTKFFGDSEKGLFFHSELSSVQPSFDIVHSSSALQYIDDWKQILSSLCALSSQYLLLADVLAGNIPTFVTVQNYYGSRIASRFLNISELLSTVNTLGYQLIYSSKFAPAILGVEQDLPMQNFPDEYRLKQACNLLFKRVEHE